MAGGQNDAAAVRFASLSFSPVTPDLIEKYAIPAGSSGAVILPSPNAGDAQATALEGSVVSRIESDRFERFVTSPEELMSGIESARHLGDEAVSIRILARDNRYTWIRVSLAD